MHLSRRYLQLFFYLVLFLSSILKATNTNFLIQIFFISFSSLLLLCNFNRNIFSEIKYNLKKNKIFFIPIFLILIYMIIQIIPLPIEFFGKFLSPFILLKDSSFKKQLMPSLFVKKTEDSW